MCPRILDTPDTGQQYKHYINLKCKTTSDKANFHAFFSNILHVFNNTRVTSYRVFKFLRWKKQSINLMNNIQQTQKVKTETDSINCSSVSSMYEIWGSFIAVAQDSRLLRCYTMYISRLLQTFGRAYCLHHLSFRNSVTIYKLHGVISQKTWKLAFLFFLKSVSPTFVLFKNNLSLSQGRSNTMRVICFGGVYFKCNHACITHFHCFSRLCIAMYCTAPTSNVTPTFVNTRSGRMTYIQRPVLILPNSYGDFHGLEPA